MRTQSHPAVPSDETVTSQLSHKVKYNLHILQIKHIKHIQRIKHVQRTNHLKHLKQIKVH